MSEAVCNTPEAMRSATGVARLLRSCYIWRMIDAPENMTHVLLRQMREENQRFQADVIGVLDHLKTVMSHLERNTAATAKMQEEMHLMRADMARDFGKIHGDLLHHENQNLSRHGETMSQLRRIEDLENTTAETKLGLDRFNTLRNRLRVRAKKTKWVSRALRSEGP